MQQSGRWQLWVGLTFAVLAVLAAEQHDWEVAGTLLGIVAFRVLLLVADGRGWLEPKFDLDRFRRCIPVEEQLRKPLDPHKLGPLMLVVMLGWEAIVVIVAGMLLGLPSSAVFVCIVAVIPLAVVVALVLVRRLPSHYR
jgi:hypothetical protein